MQPELGQHLSHILIFVASVIGAVGVYGSFHYGNILSANKDDSISSNIEQTKTELQKNTKVIDEIRASLANFGEIDKDINESYPGFSFVFVWRLKEINETRRKYLFDVGSVQKNRISIYLTESNDLAFRVVDDVGENFTTIISKKEDIFSGFSFWNFELFVKGEDKVMRIRKNGDVLKETVFDHDFFLSPEDFGEAVIATDIEKKYFADLTVQYLMKFNKTLTTDEEREILHLVMGEASAQ